MIEEGKIDERCTCSEIFDNDYETKAACNVSIYN